jgi:hypothetical protein
MQVESKLDGEIVYDFEEFCRDHGHPAGQLFTFEVTHNAVTYVYADVAGTVGGDEVTFCLDKADLVLTRKAH